MWNYTLPTSSLAPLRLIPTSGTDGRPWGTLVASATSNYTDDGGLLVALDAKAGTLIWTFRAHNVQDTDTHGIHYVPVVDSRYAPISSHSYTAVLYMTCRSVNA